MIFRVASEDSKRILEKNKFWVKDVSESVVLREGGTEDGREDVGEKTHPGLKVDKIQWLTRGSQEQVYASTIV